MPEKTSELRAGLARVMTANDAMRRELVKLVNAHKLFLPDALVAWLVGLVDVSREHDAMLGALVDEVEKLKGGKHE